jgi:hypothetical protein
MSEGPLYARLQGEGAVRDESLDESGWTLTVQLPTARWGQWLKHEPRLAELVLDAPQTPAPEPFEQVLAERRGDD